jgi:CheY-like chemotaxis protein
MRDQTARKEVDALLQEALRSAQQLKARAEGANRAKDEFISTVSHELRTPLNTIRLWSRIFASGKLLPQQVAEGSKAIDRAALAQQQLIDDLLDVSRMASGRLRPAVRDTVLRDSVEAAIEAIEPLADSRHIRLTADLSDDVGVVRVDPDRIQQVVWNLLANAVKFTPEEGHIAVRMARQDGTVEIEVRDSGIGIRPEFLPLERHPVSDTETAVVSETQDLRGVDALLVEDESGARPATQLVLEQQGVRVRPVSSAREAREAIANQWPDVLIADVGMPDEDGYVLIESVRRAEQQQGLRRLPAVAVTAFARVEDRERALAAGFDEHLPKPVDPDKLLSTLSRIIRDGEPAHEPMGSG